MNIINEKDIKNISTNDLKILMYDLSEQYNSIVSFMQLIKSEIGSRKSNENLKENNVGA